jgi:hypothetical protein
LYLLVVVKALGRHIARMVLEKPKDWIIENIIAV